MTILIATEYLLNYDGLTAYHLTLLKYLARMPGVQVIFFCPTISRDILRRALKNNVKYVFKWDQLRDARLDVAQASSSITAYEIRKYSTQVPLVFVSHGGFFWTDVPPLADLNIGHVVSVSERIRRQVLSLGCSQDRVSTILNPIDGEQFYSRGKSADTIRRVVMLPSGLADRGRIDVVKAACRGLRLQLTVVPPGKRVPDPSRLMQGADLVIGRGRIIPEALLCYKAACVFDYIGGDGLVTKDTYRDLVPSSFSGAVHHICFDEEGLKREIQKYRPQDAAALAEYVKVDFSAEKIAEQYYQLYLAAIRNFSPQKLDTQKINFICNVFHFGKYSGRRSEQIIRI